MSSLRNAVPRPAHKERPQPSSRKKFGILEKHKDYVERAKAFHVKEDTLRVLREKAANRNEDEFYFKMVNSKTVDGVHRPVNEDNKYTQDELILMKTQDMGYVLQKLQSEKKKVEKLSANLHLIDHKPANKHVYFADDREEAKELKQQLSKRKVPSTSDNIPDNIKRQIKTGKNRMVPIFKSNKECQHGPSRGNVMMDAEEAIRVDPVDNFIKKVG